MKPGLLIPVLIVAVFAVALFLVNRVGDSDPTPAVVDPGLSESVALPSDLPLPHESILVESADNEADAAEVYERAIQHFRRYEGALARSRERRPEAPVGELVSLVVEAMHAPVVSEGFLDRYLPLEPGAAPRIGPAVDWIGTIVLDEARSRFEADGEDASRAAGEAALAVWVFGKRAFTQNIRLANRLDGLAMMQSAGAALREYARGDDRLDAELFGQWASALAEIERAWQPKLQAVLSVEPSVSELVHIVDHDGDRTFRVAATLRLGIARYTSQHQEERAAADQAIARLRANDDPLIAEAAVAAAELTREQVRGLR